MNLCPNIRLQINNVKLSVSLSNLIDVTIYKDKDSYTTVLTEDNLISNWNLTKNE